MSHSNKLGKRVKKYREALELTQEQLALNSGHKVEFIRDVENGDTYPPVGSLIKISRALGQRLGTFVDDNFVPDPLISRYEDIKKISLDSMEGGGEGHYLYHSLGKGKTDRHMEPLLVHMGVDEAKEILSHEGEEFIIVTKGKIKLTYGKKEYILTPGDSAYYNTVVSHHLCAVDGPAELLAVMYTPE